MPWLPPEAIDPLAPEPDVEPVAEPVPLPVPVLPPVVPAPDVLPVPLVAPPLVEPPVVELPVADPPVALLPELLAEPPAIVPVTSTRCPTYCCRFWLSPPMSR